MHDLRSAKIPFFPCWLRYNQQKGAYEKGPSIPKGTSWRHVADNPQEYPTLDWQSSVVGVPIPAGIVVFDLDSYKGITRQDIDAALGVRLPWDQALIQRTVGGGNHYAFRCNWTVMHGSNIIGLVGFDTRTPGKGFICTGDGYEQVGYGVLRFAAPGSLPELPYIPAIEHKEKPAATDKIYSTNDSDVENALRHIDPGCGRSEWVRIGLALKNHYGDSPEGEGIFDAWSAGQLWPDGQPDNYIAEDVPGQWESFKENGGVTISTLFYRAIAGGWRPPSGFDGAIIFGKGSDNYAELVDLVRCDGCDILRIPDIVEAIITAGCSELQVSLLISELKAEIKDKNVHKQLDKIAGGTPAKMPGQYGKNDEENTRIFLEKMYPNDTLLVCDKELFAYDGKVWVKIPPELLKHQISMDMASSFPQNNKVNSCMNHTLTRVPYIVGGMSKLTPHLIVFNNGILDLNTGELLPHSKNHLNTVMMPYDYIPGHPCAKWSEFIKEILDEDAQRAKLLQEWMGYNMVNDYRLQKIMIFLGPSRCGKGTIGRVMQQLVGPDNFSGGALSDFATDSFMDELRTKPVLFMGDAEKKVSANIVNRVIERLKSVSGNDSVFFHRMYIGGIADTLPTRISISCNGIPNLFDDSGALAGRMMIVPFYNSYLGRENLNLTNELLSELPGIANWALAGLRRLNVAGRFTVPDVSRDEVEAIIEQFSPVTEFVRTGCELGRSFNCSSNDMYAAYRSWCVRTNSEAMKPQTFVKSLRDATRGDRVHYSRQSDGSRVFKGIHPLPFEHEGLSIVK